MGKWKTDGETQQEVTLREGSRQLNEGGRKKPHFKLISNLRPGVCTANVLY